MKDKIIYNPKRDRIEYDTILKIIHTTTYNTKTLKKE